MEEEEEGAHWLVLKHDGEGGCINNKIWLMEGCWREGGLPGSKYMHHEYLKLKLVIHLFYTHTVQTVTNLPPACVLLNPIACIQMMLNSNTFYGKIGPFEAVYGHPPP